MFCVRFLVFQPPTSLLFFSNFSFLFPSILTKQLDFVEQKKKKKKTGSSFYCYFFVGPFHQDKNKSHARI